MTLIIHEMLRKTRQRNATQHNSPKAVISSSYIGRDSNLQPSTFQLMLLPEAAQLAGFKSHDYTKQDKESQPMHHTT